MPLIVVGAALGLPGPQRQDRLRTVDCLHLGLFVDAEHHGSIRRIEVEPDNVADLVDEQRIGRQLEGLAAMRLQRECLPDPLHGRRRQPRGRAIPRELQCVLPTGSVSSVAVTTSATFWSVTVRGAPGRGSSRRPSRRLSAKRRRQVATVTRVVPSRSAIATLLTPSAARSTISARMASARATFRRRSRDASSAASAPDNSTVTAFGVATPLPPVLPGIQRITTASRWLVISRSRH
jgi:hypothetical protein